MKNILRLLPGLCLLLIAASVPGESIDLCIDQMQPIIDDSVGGLVIGGASQQKLAQVVTVGRIGRLRGIYLPIGCDSGRLIVEIRDVLADGTPGGILMGRNHVAAEDVGQIGPSFRFFQLEDRILGFGPGERFAIVLRNPTGSCGIFNGPLGDSYTGGGVFFDARPNPPGWIPLPVTESRLDLPFMTRMKLL